MNAFESNQSCLGAERRLLEKTVAWLIRQAEATWKLVQAEIRKRGRQVLVHVSRQLADIDNARKISLQLCIYLVIVSAITAMTLTGGDLLIHVLSNKMTAMGQDVITQNVPNAVETASLRPAIQ